MKKHFTSLMSSFFGILASFEFPKPIQNFINLSYIKLMKLDMGEFNPYDSYSSLNELFTRELKREREIDGDADTILSPTDSLITQAGVITHSTAYQIKGMEYSLRELLSEFYDDEVKSLEGGSYVNFYLSPRDYHRYHMPFDVDIESIVHIPGKLYPVNIPFLKKKRGLFIENERVIISLKDRYEKRHFLVLIGALNVGKMVVKFEPRVETNSSVEKPQHYQYEKPIKMSKAELFGWFEMGSTILLISAKGSSKLNIKTGQAVKFGEKIGRLR